MAGLYAHEGTPQGTISRNYVVGAPLVVSIMKDGSIRLIVDTSEIEDTDECTTEEAAIVRAALDDDRVIVTWE